MLNDANTRNFLLAILGLVILAVVISIAGGGIKGQLSKAIQKGAVVLVALLVLGISAGSLITFANRMTTTVGINTGAGE